MYVCIDQRHGPAVLLRERCATTALEFALIAPVLCSLIFGALELGLNLWTKNALQLTAAITARCISLGSCSTPASFAVQTAETWAIPNIITASDVSYTTTGNCNGGAGTYAQVTINCNYWGAGLLPSPFSNLTLSVSACYPMVS